MEKPRFKGFLASSADPTGQTLSTTVLSLGKVLIGIAGYFAVSKGFDPMAAQTQLQAIIDLVATSIPIIYSLWHSMETLAGLVRKFFNLFKKPTV